MRELKKACTRDLRQVNARPGCWGTMAGMQTPTSTEPPEHATHASPSMTLSPDLLRQFDTPGPRYTSYPTADRFVETFGAAAFAAALRQRAAAACTWAAARRRSCPMPSSIA